MKESKKKITCPRSVRMELLFGNDMKSNFGNRVWHAKRMLKLMEKEDINEEEHQRTSKPTGADD